MTFVKIIRILTIAFLLTLSGCIQTYYLSPKTENVNDVELFMMDGKDLAISRKDNSTIIIYADKREKNEIYLFLRYQNNSQNLLIFSHQELAFQV